METNGQKINGITKPWKLIAASFMYTLPGNDKEKDSEENVLISIGIDNNNNSIRIGNLEYKKNTNFINSDDLVAIIKDAEHRLLAGNAAADEKEADK